MRTKTINVFSFNELSDKAKENVKQKFYFDFVWQSECENSYKEAKKIYLQFEDIENEIFGVRLYKWIQNNILPELTFRYKYAKEATRYNKYPSNSPLKLYSNEKKARFSKIRINIDSINLTGVCFDYDFLAPIFDFLKNPCKHTSNIDLAKTDLDRIYQTIYQDEEEAYYQDDNFAEHCETNGYEFTENGELIW